MTLWSGEIANKYPLPQPGNINTQQVIQTVTTGAVVATEGYFLYKAIVVAATWECFGCRVLFTP